MFSLKIILSSNSQLKGHVFDEAIFFFLIYFMEV